ncbi:probable serine/threonine-protein kinase nek3 [Argopecten irradians]|uniref:probable serine/threonine-protein kinase nek3 n=1 Tax=Argopecten irradians TaxID=31199 RepID=UPI00372429B9
MFTLVLFIVFTTTASPVPNEFLIRSHEPSFSPDFDKEDSEVTVRSVFKRFAHHDSSGAFLNHFPASNPLSQTRMTRQRGSLRHTNGVHSKASTPSSAFRHTEKIVEKPNGKWTRNLYKSKQRPVNGIPNALRETSGPARYGQNDTSTDRNIRIQEWKDVSDRLMESWSYIVGDTTTQADVGYMSGSPDWNSKTTPVLRESVQHGPVRTRVPTTIHTIMGYDEKMFTTVATKPLYHFTGKHGTKPRMYGTTKSSQFSDHSHKGHNEEPVVYGTTKQTNPTLNSGKHFDLSNGGYHTKHLSYSSDKSKSILNRGHTTKPYLHRTSTSEPYIYPGTKSAVAPRVSPIVTPMITTRHVDGGYIIKPHMLQESVYPKPSQVHTRTLIPESWKIVDYGKPNTSIPVSDSKHSGQTLKNELTENKGYTTEVPYWTNTYNTLKTEASTHTTKIGTNGYREDLTNHVSPIISTTVNPPIRTVQTDSVISVPDTSQAISSSTSSTNSLAEDIITQLGNMYKASYTTYSPENSNIQHTSTNTYQQSPDMIEQTNPTLTTPVAKPTQQNGCCNDTSPKEQKDIPQTVMTYSTTTGDGVGTTTDHVIQPIRIESTLDPPITTIAAIDAKVLGTAKTVLPKTNRHKVQYGDVNKKRSFTKTSPIKVYDLTDPVHLGVNISERITKESSIPRSNFTNVHIIATSKMEMPNSQYDNRDKPVLSTNITGVNKSVKHSIHLLKSTDRPLLTKLKSEVGLLKSSKYQDKHLSLMQQKPKSVARKHHTKPKSNKGTQMDKIEWLSRLKHHHRGSISRNPGTSYYSNNQTVHIDSDINYIKRAVKVIKGLINKIQGKPIVKSIPKPERQKYLLIPLSNLTFTEIKQKLLGYQLYMKTFQNSHLSDQDLVSDVKPQTDRPIIIDQRPEQ